MLNEGSVPRRRFLAGAACMAIGVAGRLPLRLVVPHRGRAAEKRTADEAIKELLDGNARFIANRSTSVKRDVAMLRARTVDTQEPFAAVLACADSRVPVELVFDQSIGDVFVARLAGNIATPEIIASLEYAVAVLGISALVVLGHSNCGAVKAAMKTESVPGQISALYPYLRAAVERSAGSLDIAIEANARSQADLLSTSSTVIREASAKGTVKVVAGVYDLASGRVTLA